MVRVSSAVCIGFLSVLLFYGLRTHFLALQYDVSPYNQMEAASVELSTESDYTPPTYSIAAIIFHTAPVSTTLQRSCRAVEQKRWFVIHDSRALSPATCRCCG